MYALWHATTGDKRTNSYTDTNNGGAREEFVGRAVTTNGNLVEKPQWDHTANTGRRRSQSSGRDRHVHRDMAVKPADFDTSGAHDGTFSGDEWQSKQESMLTGVVDLGNTVDTDRETSWAPGKSLFFRHPVKLPNTAYTNLSDQTHNSGHTRGCQAP